MTRAHSIVCKTAIFCQYLISTSNEFYEIFQDDRLTVRMWSPVHANTGGDSEGCGLGRCFPSSLLHTYCPSGCSTVPPPPLPRYLVHAINCAGSAWVTDIS